MYAFGLAIVYGSDDDENDVSLSVSLYIRLSVFSRLSS